ncbi:sporulation protein [Clostridium chromiireducens]|uniref:Sporulation protein n=1 Tax=Clostridium chromiireducens TaxID=225345 RepID=A0A964RJ14_9CLOT|nr:spore germination protein GerW family protein [Clostridium chromiireducens]MVX62637.1 sporulation protein [Clostridium chromiireducens]
MENNALKENLESLFSNLERFIKTETVVGEPITVGEVTLVPIVSVMFGIGTGEGIKGMNGTGSGGGGGAAISPNAILVINKDEVTMLPISENSNLDNLRNMVPDIISKINVKKYKDNDEKIEEQ